MEWKADGIEAWINPEELEPERLDAAAAQRQVAAGSPDLNQSQGGNYMDSGIKTGLRVSEEFLGGFSFMYFSPWC